MLYEASSTSLCATPGVKPKPPSAFCWAPRPSAMAASRASEPLVPASADPAMAVAKTSMPVMNGRPPSGRSSATVSVNARSTAGRWAASLRRASSPSRRAR